MSTNATAKHGDLRVWWIPQVPGKPFHQEVDNLKEAKLLLTTLARYDAFQFENRIKPDYANAGGLLVYDTDMEEGGEWVDYDWDYDPERFGHENPFPREEDEE